MFYVLVGMNTITTVSHLPCQSKTKIQLPMFYKRFNGKMNIHVQLNHTIQKMLHYHTRVQTRQVLPHENSSQPLQLRLLIWYPRGVSLLVSSSSARIILKVNVYELCRIAVCRLASTGARFISVFYNILSCFGPPLLRLLLLRI